MYEILLVILVVVAVGLIGLVMLQQGKGATMGASFGAGASNTLFGSSGAANFMTRTTAVFATLFFIISLALGNLSARTGKISVGTDSKWDNIGINSGSPAVKEPANIVIPATPKVDDSKDSTSGNVDIPR